MMKNVLRTAVFVLLLASAAGFLPGCATDDSTPKDPNVWNRPQIWENPLPSDMNNAR